MWFKRICAAGLAVFLALSLTDFVQTFALITGSDGAVYEANPIADAWLAKHGWTGLAAFKAGIVLVGRTSMSPATDRFGAVAP